MSLGLSFPSPDRGRVFLNGHAESLSGRITPHTLTIALSVQAKEYPGRFFWARDNAFALEYTPEPLFPELIPRHVNPFTEDGIPVRFHCRFGEFELGNADPEKAAEALAVHSRIIDAITGIGEPVVTVHLNLVKSIPFDIQRGLENLTRLVEHARKRGITVCLENLKRGPTSDPTNVLAWATASGAMITMDVGHAVSSEYVKEVKNIIPGIVELFHERLREVHMYGKEEDRHYPIEDMAQFKPIIDRLLTTGCAWWTIELDSCEEALVTRQRLLGYLATRYTNQNTERSYQ